MAANLRAEPIAQQDEQPARVSALLPECLNHREG